MNNIMQICVDMIELDLISKDVSVQFFKSDVLTKQGFVTGEEEWRWQIVAKLPINTPNLKKYGELTDFAKLRGLDVVLANNSLDTIIIRDAREADENP